MKKLLGLLVFLVYTIGLFAQEENNFSLLSTDSTWNKEVFHFPIGFAQDIPYEGFEEAVFPEYWSKKDSSDFWSYVFAWRIEANEMLSAHTLEDDLQKYFNGLMECETTSALFLKREETKTVTNFIGKVKTNDRFFTKKTMTLHVQVEQHFCQEKETVLLVFRFSPREFEDEVWEKLGEVGPRAGVCEL